MRRPPWISFSTWTSSCSAGGTWQQVYAELESAAPRWFRSGPGAGDDHAWVHWVARFPGVDRDRLAKELDRLGVVTKPYYGPVLHHQSWKGAAEVPTDTDRDRLCTVRRSPCRCPAELSSGRCRAHLLDSAQRVLDGLRGGPIMSSGLPRSARAGTPGQSRSAAESRVVVRRPAGAGQRVTAIGAGADEQPGDLDDFETGIGHDCLQGRPCRTSGGPPRRRPRTRSLGASSRPLKCLGSWRPATGSPAPVPARKCDQHSTAHLQDAARAARCVL